MAAFVFVFFEQR